MTVLHQRLPGSKDVFFEETLVDKFQIFSGSSVAGSLVYLTVLVRTIFLHSGECRVVLDWLRALYPRLVLDGIEDFVYGEP